MLDCITGRSTLNRDAELTSDSGLHSGKNDFNRGSVPDEEPDHYMSDKNMMHASLNQQILQSKDSNNETQPRPSVTSFGKVSILSTSSGSSDDEDSSSHPDHYTATLRPISTLSELASDSSSQVEQLADYYEASIQEDVVSEDDSVTDDD